MNIKDSIFARWFYQFVRPHPNFYRKVTSIGIIPSEESLRLIVSLTSFPARIKTVSYTIETILSQTKKPNMVILWLAEEQFPQKEKSLPKKLLRLCQYGLKICWCEDIRSYKKLIPSLKAFPEDIIVTADDDVYYPPTWLERLYSSYLKTPNCIHAHRVHEVNITNGKIDMYNNWGTDLVGPKEPSTRMHFTGIGGVLYPPHCLYNDICREDLFMDLAPSVDDIWFWAMALLAGTKCILIENNTNVFEGVFIVNNKSLWSTNVDGRNDIALTKIIKMYPELEGIIINNK